MTVDGDPGLFGPASVTWRVNRELVLLLGGGRALLMQVAHPLVAAGVAQHSDYERDPWGRLWRTLELTTTIVFGDAAAARAAAERIWRVHGRVHGTAADGTPYDARDPDLLVWVWATLVDSALLVHGRCVGPLAARELERYHAEQVRFAEALGVPAGRAPATPAAFRAYLERMLAHELRVTEPARAVAAATLRPPLPLASRPLGAALGTLTAGLLPPPLRDAYGFAWGPARTRGLDASLALARRLLPLAPSPARAFPAARAADRRVSAAA